MIPDISAAIALFKGINEILGTLDSVKSGDEIRESKVKLNFLIIELQSHLTTLQAIHSDLLNAHNQLKQHTTEIEDWERQAQKYALYELAAGVFTYIEKKPVQATKAPMHFCSHCFGERKRSILQRRNQDHHGTYYLCPSCKFVVCDHEDCLPLSYG